MSKELKYGLLMGRGSVDRLLDAVEKALGVEAAVLAYLEECGVASELELVASISYILGKKFELTPPLKARIAACLSRKTRLLLSLEGMLVEEGGEAYE